ncbi:MAG TPA: bacteriohopanetetrol glucosamine biosynthesis glycosyltransferase HpnI [Candidatus Angelobacter sp.]|jgi:ceramide glucosyltransferase|nr:bacteriohopanetetrol glucosamine biosynthesis glycosyltransferase HpnI [Candidatus Angelobacter sp.]
MVVLTAVFGILLAGSLVFCVLVIFATRDYLRVPHRAASVLPPVSILKPLCGHDEGLEENLRSFFVQDYPEYEVLLGVHRLDDPACPIAERLIEEYADKVTARIVVTGESPIPNAKAFTLKRLVIESRHEILAMADSDVRVAKDFLRRIAAEFEDRAVGLITCPYRAVGGASLWSRLEAIGMNTELLGGVVVARMIEGMKFALGCALAVRRDVLEEMGGFAYLQEFLAEDFVIGSRAAELGHTVLLSSSVIEHRIGSQAMLRNLTHRLRWARSTRRSRPLGYYGQIFTYPLPLALLLFAVHPAAWPMLVITLVTRSSAAIATGHFMVRDPLLVEQWWLLPVQDILGFFVWLGGFLGDKIVWRDRKITVLRDGRLEVNS